MDAPDLRQDSERVGKPPRMRLHQEPKDNLEHIPTHDSTPCTSIWREPIFPDDDQPLVRPIYSLQIYDTTPHSSKQSYFDAVATTIQKSTFDEQDGYDSMQQIRLDFYGLEMPEGFPETERVERCIRHQKKEIAARNATGKMDYYIPRTFDERDWQRELYIIDREEKHWAEGEDGFLKIMFDPIQREREEDDQVPEVHWVRIKGLKELGTFFQHDKQFRPWFYNCYIGGGKNQEELR